MIISTALLNCLENKLILFWLFFLINANILKGICMIKNNDTNKLEILREDALTILNFANSPNPLIVPQNGQLIPNSLSKRQKCGKKFKK